LTGVLGERVDAPTRYSPEILEAIPRQPARERLGIDGRYGQGWDAWHLYELSWLEAGRPISACGVLGIPSTSPATVESKSLKLYLNSLNFHDFPSRDAATACIVDDISAICGETVILEVGAPEQMGAWTRTAAGTCIDRETFDIAKLEAGGPHIEETLHSHLLRSLCPVTGQPDWATVEISYRGAQINRGGLLSLILSYREHQDFHEQCLEKLFAEIYSQCTPEELTVSAFYTRRGGIDITPHRSSATFELIFDRLARQ
jgi:7-cyano-7-deazaguanine reductase